MTPHTTLEPVADASASASSETTEALVLRGVQRSFGLRRILRGVDLTVTRGQRLALFGPNGAGKTTLLRIIAALLRPDRGSVTVDGWDVGDDAMEVRRRIGFASHQPLLYPELSAVENLRFFGNLYAVEDIEQRIAELLDWTGLSARRHDRVSTYSRGMQQRMALARAVLHDPAVLLLDEPDTGLDITALGLLDDLARGCDADGRTLVISTHDIGRGLALADKVCVLLHGRIVLYEDAAAFTPGELRRRFEALLRGAM